MKKSLGKSDWRTQLTVAYAIITVIPLLAFGYFLVSYLVPETATRENFLLVVILNMLLSIAGFCVLYKMLRSFSRFRGYVENVARGSLDGQEMFRNGSEVASINKSEVSRRTKDLEEDIEHRKRVEQALRESNMMLSDALSELKEMERRLLQEERMSALGQMASSIAHDFNNALMPIVGLTEFLLMNRDKLDDKEELIETLEDIHTSADHACQTVVRLRDFYKSEDGLEIGVVDVNVVFDKAIAACGEIIQKGKRSGKLIDICRKYGDVPLVNADESELREAIRNVIVNAIESMSEGGSINCCSRLEGKWVVLEIVDTGVGMTPDVQAHCMDPFFSTKGLHGAGIGLSVVYGIARRHRGNVEIKSEPGKGTSVRILLPTMRVSAPVASGVPSGISDIGPIRVLVIDDDIASRSILSRYLSAVGHTVKTAESGARGIEMFAEDNVDLVITDRAMPDMSGDAVAASIKKIDMQVPIIMLTGFGEIMKDRCEKPEGVDMVLGKPVSLKELKQAICGLIGARVVRQAQR